MPALAELLDALATTPDLHGAACVTHVDLFDATVARGRAGQLHAQAIAVCAVCPALAQCADWINHLPAGQRPYGVIAGEYRPQRATGGEAASESTSPRRSAQRTALLRTEIATPTHRD